MISRHRNVLLSTAITVIVGAAFLMLPLAGAQASPGLVGAYSFDEGTGTTVSDLSGSGNQGSIFQATWTATAKYGKALNFDGSNDWVTVTDSASLDLADTITLEAWVRPTSTSGWRTVILKEVPGELAYALYSSDPDHSRWPSGWVRFETTSGGSHFTEGAAILPLNTWTHLATTFDGTTLRLFVNGTQVRSRTYSGSIQTSNSPLRIGGNAVWGEYFRGQLDEIRVYNRALSQSEIVADMNAPLGTPDTTPPTASLTAPADGATVTNTVTVSADAADNAAVAGVQFLLDGANLGTEDTTAPYSVSWNTFAASAGSHTLAARVRDSAGNVTTSATHTVTAVPQLVITEPANNAAVNAGTVTVRYRADGDASGAGVDHVHVVLDSNPYVPDIDFDGVMEFTNVAPGSHTITGFLVRADHTTINGTDASLVNFTATASDTTPPDVTITSPAAESIVSGTVSATAVATDDIGITGVQFKLDGTNLGAEDTTSPYSISWNTTTAANGPHILTAVARDAAGNSTTSGSVAVSVNNTDIRAQIGEWAAPFNIPLVAIHLSLLPNGKVLMVDSQDFNSSQSQVVWDPTTGTTSNIPETNTDLFCSGHSVLDDGTVLFVGGDTHSTGLGVNDVNAFDFSTQTWSSKAPMNFRRWYATSTTLSDNRAFVMSGYEDGYTPSELVGTHEIYNPAINTWTPVPASGNYTVPSYPFNFVLPDGRLINAGSYEGTLDTRIFDFATNAWSVLDPTPIDAGSAVMYAPGKIMKAGKWANSDPPFVAAHPFTYVLDANQPNATWRQTANMNFPRGYLVLTLLPDGTTIATGGSRSTDPGNNAQAVLEAEIWNPQSEAWTTMTAMQNSRLYHGTAMLLPDGRVLVAGSGRYGSTERFNGEVFSPPYLFKGPRPVINAAPSTVQHGSNFFVETPDGASIAKASLIRIGSMTHSFNADQRFLNLTFSQTTGGLNVQAPADANTAPPGYYMLFILNGNGVPSIASFVRLPSTTEDATPPTTPTNLTATGSIGVADLTWTAATDNIGVARYNVHRSSTAGFTPTAGNRVGQPTGTTFTDTGLSVGVYYYQVTAEDAAGNTSPPSNEASATASADTSAPQVVMTAPANEATVSGTVTVSADASDNVAVAGVQFLLDDANLGAEDTSAPYSTTWNTLAAANGTHTLTARARDTGGNTTTSSLVTVTVSNSAPSGLVAAYGFSEGSGTTVADASGNSNAGALSGPAWTTAGKYGNALTYDGTNDWVTVTDNASLDLTNNMTLEAWVNPSTINSWETVILKEAIGELAYALYADDNSENGGPRRPGTWIRQGNASHFTLGTSQLPTNQWTHLAATYDGANLRLYVNGTLASTLARTGNMNVTTGPLRFGGNSVWNEWFNGTIDEIRIYNRALGQTEIQNDMNTPIGS